MLGSFLDPLADKILVSTLYLSLTYADIIPIALTSLVVSRYSHHLRNRRLKSRNIKKGHPDHGLNLGMQRLLLNFIAVKYMSPVSPIFHIVVRSNKRTHTLWGEWSKKGRELEWNINSNSPWTDLSPTLKYSRKNILNDCNSLLFFSY